MYLVRWLSCSVFSSHRYVRAFSVFLCLSLYMVRVPLVLSSIYSLLIKKNGEIWTLIGSSPNPVKMNVYKFTFFCYVILFFEIEGESKSLHMLMMITNLYACLCWLVWWLLTLCLLSIPFYCLNSTYKFPWFFRDLELCQNCPRSCFNSIVLFPIHIISLLILVALSILI